MRIAGNDHVEAIGAQIDGGDDVGDFGTRHERAFEYWIHEVGNRLPACKCTARTCRRCQVENDEPQPQVVAAFGLRMTNCAPSMSSL